MAFRSSFLLLLSFSLIYLSINLKLLFSLCKLDMLLLSVLGRGEHVADCTLLLSQLVAVELEANFSQK